MKNARRDLPRSSRVVRPGHPWVRIIGPTFPTAADCYVSSFVDGGHHRLDPPRVELLEPSVGEVENGQLGQAVHPGDALHLARPQRAHLLDRQPQLVADAGGAAAGEHQQEHLVPLPELLRHGGARAEGFVVGVREHVE